MSDPLALECVYYASPIPRSAAVLTMLGVIFDKIHFPGVAMPMGGYDPAELKREINRLEALGHGPRGDTHILISMMRFVEHAQTLKGLCVFPGEGDLLGKQNREEATTRHRLMDELYDSIHGPRRPGWTPMLGQTHFKGIPGSEQTIIYPDPYLYMAGSVLEADRKGISLLVDVPGLPVPTVGEASLRDNAQALATLLTIHCTGLVLPKMSVLSPQELMDFRAENETHLRRFRRAMLRYAGELNSEIADIPPEQIEGKADFFVKTRILPELDELRESLAHTSRKWTDRIKDGLQIAGELIPACFSPNPRAAVGMALLKNVPGFLGREIAAAGEASGKRRRSDLYYLLNVEKVGN